jgi:hypothetical protein
MAQFYSDPSREGDKWSLPDCEVFQLTAREVAERDEDLIHQYMRRHEFRLASMNSATREKMFDAMIEDEGIEGGWFYWFCLPGCMPDSEPFGPYKTRDDAVAAARESVDS